MKSWALVTVSMLLSVAAFGQVFSGGISGLVRDNSGAVVPGAVVTAINEGNLRQQRTTTNGSGYYNFPRLEVGAYTISVQKQGFEKSTKTGINLHAAEQLTVPVVLSVGALTQTVTVSASAATLTLSPTTGGTVVSHQISQLEVNGRNPIFLALLEPGVNAAARNESIGTFDPQDVSSGYYDINGGRDDSDNVYIDGAQATRTRSSGSMLGAQNMDTIQEMRVLTGNYSAEYGRASGGIILFVTKSGTADFHGDLTETLRNAAFDANTWSRNGSPIASENSAPAKNDFNDFGFSLGGPIYIPGKFNKDRSKLFFFLGEEWVRRDYSATQTATVPTLAMRGGDLSQLLQPNNTFFGKTEVAVNPATGQPFPGNIIPTSMINAEGQALLNAYPAPTPGFQLGALNWIGTGNIVSNSNNTAFKVDYFINSKNHLSVRGTIIPWTFNNPFEGNMELFQSLWSRPNETGVINLDTTISPSFLNELTISGNSDGKGTIYANPACGAVCNRSTYGINYPYLFPGTKWDAQKLPDVTVNGLTSISNGPYPGTWAGWVYDFGDNLTKIAGNHTIKFGGYFENAGQNDLIQLTTASAPQTVNQNGAFEFLNTGAPGTTGLGIGNALLGNFNSYSEFGANPTSTVSSDF